LETVRNKEASSMGAEPKKKNRIAILTGGGDVPGLNPCIKTLVLRADSEGIEVIGVRRGWAGLLKYNRDAPLDDSGKNSKEQTIVSVSQPPLREV
jgi:6-phosphofructokinase